jgi:hypothetical protein
VFGFDFKLNRGAGIGLLRQFVATKKEKDKKRK